jgi:hypothetical protein
VSGWLSRSRYPRRGEAVCSCLDSDRRRTGAALRKGTMILRLMATVTSGLAGGADGEHDHPSVSRSVHALLPIGGLTSFWPDRTLERPQESVVGAV